MTNLDNILKSRDITLPTKVHIAKAMVFPVVMYGCESCTIKKAESQRTEVFELWCWRRLLRVQWTARRSNQWILKEINPEYSLEGLMLKLKLQFFGCCCCCCCCCIASVMPNSVQHAQLIDGSPPGSPTPGILQGRTLEWVAISFSNSLATWCKEVTHWKRPWCWERLRAGSKGNDRGRDSWRASLIQWAWVWANSGR